jgi:MoaA/NifB/PqqE/SkfB family radical SAM enzyme
MIKRDYLGFTLFVTTICNLRCQYCFNLENLGKGTDDLTFEEIEKLSNHLPPMNGVLYSGGEPLIRQDIVEISNLFIQKNHFKGFIIPTNAVDMENTLSKIEAISNLNPTPEIVACCGLDVIEDTHDRLRGKGTYKKVIETIKELVKLKQSKKNISILINSVLGKSSIPQLNDFVRFARTLNPDLHSLEVVRDEKIQLYDGNFHGNNKALNTETIFQTMSSDDFDMVKQARLLIDELYRKEDILYGLYKLRSNMMTDLQRDTLLYNKKWPAACMAGRTGFVVQSNGDISVCENLSPLGNLRKDGFDPIKIIKDRGGAQFQGIQNHACDCAHYVYVKDMLEHNFPGALAKYLIQK